jgi:hypothetical protein
VQVRERAPEAKKRRMFGTKNGRLNRKKEWECNKRGRRPIFEKLCIAFLLWPKKSWGAERKAGDVGFAEFCMR